MSDSLVPDPPRTRPVGKIRGRERKEGLVNGLTSRCSSNPNRCNEITAHTCIKC